MCLLSQNCAITNYTIYASLTAHPEQAAAAVWCSRVSTTALAFAWPRRVNIFWNGKEAPKIAGHTQRSHWVPWRLPPERYEITFTYFVNPITNHMAKINGNNNQQL